MKKKEKTLLDRISLDFGKILLGGIILNILFLLLIITLQLPLALSCPKHTCKRSKNDSVLMSESKNQAGRKGVAAQCMKSRPKLHSDFSIDPLSEPGQKS